MDEYPYSPRTPQVTEPPESSISPPQMTTQDEPFQRYHRMAAFASGIVGVVALFVAVLPISRSSLLAYEASRLCFAAIVLIWLVVESGRAWHVSFGSGRKQVTTSRPVHSVPRRFGMGTLLAVTFAFGLLSTLCRWMLLQPVAIMLAFAFIGLVGFLQFILDRAPRQASILAGVAFLAVPMMGYTLVANPNYFSEASPSELAFRAACIVVLGAVVGYCTGVAVGSLFMFLTWGRSLASRNADKSRIA